MAQQPGLLEAAERIADVLAARGIGALVIGAAALAAHRYVRHTEDIDLGVNVSIKDLQPVKDSPVNGTSAPVFRLMSDS